MHKIPSAAVVFLAVLLCSPAVAATLVANGGFETGNFNAWSVTGYDSSCGTNPDQFCGVSGIIPVAGGAYAAYFGPLGADTFLSQTLPLAPSTTYTLTFSLDEYISPSTGYTNAFAVSADGTTLLSESNVSDTGGYEPVTLNFSTAASGNSDLLEFTFRNDAGYFYLDNVSVTASSPEPSSFVLLLIGLAAATGLKVSRSR